MVIYVIIHGMKLGVQTLIGQALGKQSVGELTDDQKEQIKYLEKLEEDAIVNGIDPRELDELAIKKLIKNQEKNRQNQKYLEFLEKIQKFQTKKPSHDGVIDQKE